MQNLTDAYFGSRRSFSSTMDIMSQLEVCFSSDIHLNFKSTNFFSLQLCLGAWTVELHMNHNWHAHHILQKIS